MVYKDIDRTLGAPMLTDIAYRDYQSLTDEQKEKINSNIPANQMGSPEDIAAAAVYLASDEAKYVTGQTIHINGGLYM